MPFLIEVKEAMATPANQSRNYVNFIQARDQALEVLLNQAQVKITDLSRNVFLRVLEIVASRYGVLAHESLISKRTRDMIRSIDFELDYLFQTFAPQYVTIIETLSAQSYTLALVGEVEALARAMNEPARYDINPGEVEKVVKSGRDGEDISSRIMITLDRLRRQIVNAVELSFIQKENTNEMLKRVYAKLPKKRTVKRPPRELTKLMREADKKEKISLAVGTVSDEKWDEIVDAYKSEYVPAYRSPETVFGLPDGSTAIKQDERYSWEIEQEVSDKFVRDVRQAAKDGDAKNGITDFIWIAVIDDKTDECCSWRDGLSSQDIEQGLKGKHKNDECKVITPPAHYNCRCTLAPMLKDMPEVEASNLQDFEEWLES